MSDKNKTVRGWLLLALLGVFVFKSCDLAAARDQVMISEVMIGGEKSASDEFIELYNPQSSAVNLTNWKMLKKTAAGKEYEVWAGSDVEIPAGGYFLIVPPAHCGENKDAPCYLGTVVADASYTKAVYLAEDSALVLYDREGMVADQLGWGGAADFEGEVFPYNPLRGESLERKTASAQLQDTDNNAADFFMQTRPAAHNSSSTPDDASEVPVAEEKPDSPRDSTDATPTKDEADTTPADEDDNPDPDAIGAATVPSSMNLAVSEFLINPTGNDGEMEFIEIYNAGTRAVDFSGWSLSDQVGQVRQYVFPSPSLIGAGRYQVFFSSETKISLNNSGDAVLLRDASGQVVSQTPNSGATPEDVAFALSASGQWAQTALPTPAGKNVIREVEIASDAAKQPSSDATVAKNVAVTSAEEEPAEENYDFSDEVIINEILPNPAGDDNRDGNWEWVELFNSGSRPVNLQNWCLDDYLDKGSKAFCWEKEVRIAAAGYVVVSGSESGLLLNNAAEEVNLLLPDGSVADSVAYTKARENYSLSRAADGTWSWAKNPTPQKKNGKAETAIQTIASKIIKAAGASGASGIGETEAEGEISDGDEALPASSIDRSAFASVSVGAAKLLPLGSPVALSGLVAVAPGVLGDRVFYLNDRASGAGIQIFGGKDGGDGLSLGDEIEVCGSLSSVGGESRLLLAEDIAVSKTSSDNLLPVSPLDFEKLDGLLGSLVQAEGVARDVGGNLFYLETEKGKIKVYAESGTGLSFDELSAGQRVAVTGILSRTSASYRLLPRTGSDLRFFEKGNDGIMAADNTEPEMARAGDSPLVRMFFFLSFLILLDWSRMRMKGGDKPLRRNLWKSPQLPKIKETKTKTKVEAEE